MNNQDEEMGDWEEESLDSPDVLELERRVEELERGEAAFSAAVAEFMSRSPTATMGGAARTEEDEFDFDHGPMAFPPYRSPGQ
ncbi:hypothetical protein TWF696_003854 [Orbilia brochopaga]|uniref:Uncharacterized protein n=1 Tax=Orbilia brochopaga TaxID=3140254 RepID=A0AAV9V6Q0_9PEZI